jgi:predicted GIY-YIG superfamily endonuclease
MKYVYILRSMSRPFNFAPFDLAQGRPGQLYVGSTADLSQRLSYHNSGRCPHTSKFRPWEVAYTEQFENEADAFKRERQIKGWTREKKEALILGNRKTLKELAKRRVF